MRRWNCRRAWQTRSRAGGDADDLMLRGGDLTDALAWAARRKENAPEIAPSNVATAAPVAASHSLAVLSAEPVRTRLPSGEKATVST